MLHKSDTNNIKVVSNEEQPTNLCSNNVGMGCSSLDITSNEEKSIEDLIDELADIFIESLLLELKNGKQEKGSHILPCVNQRTS